MVNVAVIGVGFVGLTHAAVTAKFGHNVIGYDISKEKIKAFNSGKSNQINKYVHEKGLPTIIEEELKNKRLKFTTDINQISNCEVFFMSVPTPALPSGESNLSYLYQAAEDLMPILKKNRNFKLIVVKSTVPVGTCKALFDHLTKKGLDNFDVASNPEFLPEGNAVEYAVHSAKVIIGTENPKSRELLRRVYSNFCNRPDTTYLETTTQNSEFIKYASNVLLYNQIVMWQSIVAPLADVEPGINFEDVRKGVLADKRIARWGSYMTAGAGGSCFKKDSLSLSYQFKKRKLDGSYPKMIDDINESYKTYLITRAENEGKYSFKGKAVAMLGVAFKQETNDIRDSNALAMIPLLLKKGVSQINIYDPFAAEQAKNYFDPAKNKDFKKIKYSTDAKSALAGTDAAIIATDHQEFRTIKDSLMKTKIKKPYLVIDGRRMLHKTDVAELLKEGVSYLPIAGVFQKAENKK